ncbi:MAG: hypothetical protein K2X82_23155 [Gemmataceae bacterium]|nr:hypothetical protein [Gemmataceae bacterium]MBX9626719.1 hypothetical protein [Gemmataceae bacterium]
MSRLAAGLAAAALLSVPAAAHAQFSVNRIQNSGNGVNNTVVARNSPARGHFPGYAPAYGVPGGADAGYGYGPQVGYPAGHVFGPEFRRNVILDSGNGIGNTIVARNGGFGGGGYPFGPHGVFGPGGLNINVVTNSGNGVGNTVHTTNRGGPGGININVITNSGNGVGNTIRTRNR